MQMQMQKCPNTLSTICTCQVFRKILFNPVKFPVLFNFRLRCSQAQDSTCFIVNISRGIANVTLSSIYSQSRNTSNHTFPPLYFSNWHIRRPASSKLHAWQHARRHVSNEKTKSIKSSSFYRTTYTVICKVASILFCVMLNEFNVNTILDLVLK